MSGSRTKYIFLTLALCGLATAAFAQNSTEYTPAPPRAASFLPDAVAPANDFSGLAASPPQLAPPPLPTPATTQASTPITTPPATAALPAPTDIIAAPVNTAPLANISPESIGLQNSDGLGAAMWKGTSHIIAEHVLSITGLTNSPVLNNLTRRLLTTAATPPEGDAESTQSLTSMRVEKLVALGDTADAWTLATRANAKLIDDTMFHLAAEYETANDASVLCPQLTTFVQNRTGADWQKDLIVCQLFAKDSKSAQVALDVMRAQPKRDDMFLEVADKNVMSDGKTLPHQLTPLTPSMLALLRLTNISLPGELYGHPDYSLVPALLHAPAKEDVAQLGLAERAAQRGVISNDTLAAIYKTINFPPEKLAAPLGGSESGSRQRALLYQAAIGEKNPAQKILYALKFVQFSPPDLLNAIGPLVADMLGTIKADAAFQDSAATVARIYMLANKGDAALDWYHLAHGTTTQQDDMQALWPQFVLAGLEADGDFVGDLDKWLGNILKQTDPQADTRPARDAASIVLLLLDASGFKIPDAAWAKVFAAPHNEKRVALSPVLFDRLQSAAADNRRAETVLLAVGVAGDGDISLPAAVGITRALRQIGLKNEAATFARQEVAVLGKIN